MAQGEGERYRDLNREDLVRLARQRGVLGPEDKDSDELLDLLEGRGSKQGASRRINPGAPGRVGDRAAAPKPGNQGRDHRDRGHGQDGH